MKKLDPAVIAMAEKRVADSPRGAPITLPADDAPPVMVGVPEPQPEPHCAIENAPVNSVMVKLPMWENKPTVILQTPNGEIPVPLDDAFWSLPVNAEIKKPQAGVYIASQRDDQLGKAPLVCYSAMECVRFFKRHFHDERE